MHEWRSHTAEVELVIEAATAEDVFAEAAAAFRELVALGDGDEQTRREVTVNAPDLEALLVAWLEELIFLADTEGFVARRVEDTCMDGNTLRATLAGEQVAVEPLVKAATYHGLRFVKEDDTWHARVVLDV